MKENKLKTIVKLVAILIIIFISFIGIYKQDLNKMKNIVKPYNFVNDLLGYREIIFKIENSNTENEEEDNTKQELKKSDLDKTKTILEKRLKSFGVTDYNIGIDYSDGSVYLKIPEDSNTDHTISNLFQVGKFEIKDADDSTKIFLSNNDIEKVLVSYSAAETGGTIANLRIEFNKNGKEVLKEISSGEYATKQEETNTTTTETTDDQNENVEAEDANVSEENNEIDENESDASENETQKKIVLSIDDNDLITTSFDDPVETGVLGMTLNAATTDEETLKNSLQYGSTISTILNSGVLPFKYTNAENVYTETDINLSLYVKIICIVTIFSLIVLIIKFKLKGAIASIYFIGYEALLLLLIRYTNVQITIESFVAGAIVLLVNYIINYNLLKFEETNIELKNKEIAKVFKEIIIKIIPIFIISIIFVFVKWSKISCFGMVLFWGLILSILYNYLIVTLGKE